MELLSHFLIDMLKNMNFMYFFPEKNPFKSFGRKKSKPPITGVHAKNFLGHILGYMLKTPIFWQTNPKVRLQFHRIFDKLL